MQMILLSQAKQRNFLKMAYYRLWRNLWQKEDWSCLRKKTVITHITDGFDFLGCNIRLYKDKLLTKLSKRITKQSWIKSVQSLKVMQHADRKI